MDSAHLNLIVPSTNDQESITNVASCRVLMLAVSAFDSSIETPFNIAPQVKVSLINASEVNLG